MSELIDLATRLGVHERTLRRAAARGALRVRRDGPRRLRLDPGEYEYVRTRWPLLGRLVRELRTLPHVRLAVVFGSVARGDDDERSDLDLLVHLQNDGVHTHALVVDRLEQASGRRVQLVRVEAAPPLLLRDVLRQGRVLVDRDGDWLPLKADQAAVERQAALADIALEREAWAALEEPVAAG